MDGIITTITGNEWRFEKCQGPPVFCMVTGDPWQQDHYDDGGEVGITLYEWEDEAHEVVVGFGRRLCAEQRSRLTKELGSLYGCDVLLAEISRAVEGDGDDDHYVYRVEGVRGCNASWKMAAKRLFSPERKRIARRLREA